MDRGGGDLRQIQRVREYIELLHKRVSAEQTIFKVKIDLSIGLDVI